MQCDINVEAADDRRRGAVGGLAGELEERVGDALGNIGSVDLSSEGDVWGFCATTEEEAVDDMLVGAVDSSTSVLSS